MKTTSFLIILVLLFVGCDKKEETKKSDPEKVAIALALADSARSHYDFENADDTMHITNLRAMVARGDVTWDDVDWSMGDSTAEQFRRNIIYNVAINKLEKAYDNRNNPDILLLNLAESRILINSIDNDLPSIRYHAGMRTLEELESLLLTEDAFLDSDKPKLYNIRGNLYLSKFPGDRWVRLVIDTATTELYAFPGKTKETHGIRLFSFENPDAYKTYFNKPGIQKANFELDPDIASWVYRTGIKWGYWTKSKYHSHWVEGRWIWPGGSMDSVD